MDASPAVSQFHQALTHSHAETNNQPTDLTNFLPPMTDLRPREGRSNHNSTRPVSDRVVSPSDLDRRGSRSRLKAVSVDDNCRDRPKSWHRDALVLDAKSMPAIEDSAGPEDFPASNGHCQPVSEVPLQSGAPQRSPALVNDAPQVASHDAPTPALPDFEQLAAPVMLDTLPKDNASAMLKSPNSSIDLPATRPNNSAQPAPYNSPVEDDHMVTAYPDYDIPRSQPAYNTVIPRLTPEEEDSPRHLVNGRPDLEEELEDDPLPPLHISEDDLASSGYPKRDSFVSEYLPPPPPPPPQYGSEEEEALYSPYTMSPPYEQQLPRLDPAPSVDGSTSYYMSPDEDFVSSTLDSSPTQASSSPGHTPYQNNMYAWDPTSPLNSPDTDYDQFMHRSPCQPDSVQDKDLSPLGTKSKPGYALGSSLIDQRDYQLRMQNVRPDQDPIPI